MENSDRFQMVVNGSTYTTQKATPKLRGKIMKMMAHVQKEISGHSIDEAETNEWMSMAVAGALYEVAPPVMWAFLDADDQRRIGTREVFEESLGVEDISAFFSWTCEQLQDTQRFLGNTPVKKQAVESQKEQTSSLPPSADSTAGPLETANS